MPAKRNVAEFQNRTKKMREIAENICDWEEYNFVLRFVADCEKMITGARRT
jgi:hypothetical protein